MLGSCSFILTDLLTNLFKLFDMNIKLVIYARRSVVTIKSIRLDISFDRGNGFSKKFDTAFSKLAL